MNAPEGHTSPSGVARRCRSAGVLRPWQAGSETSKHVGGPRRFWETRQAEADGHRGSPRHAPGESSHAEDAAVGNAHDQGKDVTAGRRPHRTRRPDPVGPDHQKPTARQGIASNAPANTRHRGRELSRGRDAERWLVCWRDLNKEAARGVDHVPAEASAATVQATSAALVQRLNAQRDRATRVRRGDMPKATGKDRP